MSGAGRPSHRQAIADYDQAVGQLANALEGVWRACEHLDGPNLAEALSYALGSAAKRLAADVTIGENHGGLEAYESGCLYEAAGNLLVRHRPGSWEAEHIRRLVFPPELIADPT
jgi:hypothetical protein